MEYKELEETILVFRFNEMIAASWSSKDIDFIRIVTREDIGMELLSVIALAPPKHFTSSAIEKEKRRVLRRIQKDQPGKFFINNARWRGAAFYIETVNQIPESSEGITIVYKVSNFPLCDISEPNRIFLSVRSADIYINLLKPGINFKKPGKKSYALVPFHLDLSYKVPGENYWASVRVPMVPSKNV